MTRAGGHHRSSRLLAKSGAISAAAAFLVLALSAVPGAAQAPDTEQIECHIGAYQLPGGEIVDIGASDGGLRWRGFDGQTGKLVRGADGWAHTRGWTNQPDPRRLSFGACDSGTLLFEGKVARRMPLKALETTFVSRGARLAGRLVLPPGDGPVPIVVLLQGSERDSARRFDPLQRLLPAAGVGAFVYDKRGTGASEGSYTQDFSVLADDAVAALQLARRLAGTRAGRIGYHGPSQGGWVAPMAATRATPDFVIVSFGLAVSVLEEDAEAVSFQMRLKGHGPEQIRMALELCRAAGRVFESGFSEGIEELEVLRNRYRAAPWYGDVQGNFTGVILGLTPEQLQTNGPAFRWGTPFRYDPRTTLRRLNIPQLWVLGGQDIDAPPGATVRRLRRLADGRRPITVALYPTAEHGITEFELTPDRSRRSTRYSEGYFRMLADFARNSRLRPPYGDARIDPAP